MKKLKNEIMLITYADSMGKDISKLHGILKKYFDGAIGGVHLLPFFPSSGDRGFAPMTYREVDPVFGTWDDVAALGEDYTLMADYMINHISAKSEYYRDFLRNKDASAYRDLFIRYKQFWPGGEPTVDQVDAIYKRKPRAPYAVAQFADGTEEKVWCTFDEEQIDINIYSDASRSFMRENLMALAAHGIAIVRLDAFAYATKQPGTNCFFVEPGVWDLLAQAQATLACFGMVLLPEIHEHYTLQLKIAEKGYYVYDFALPMLLLNALYYGESKYLKHWLTICPRNQFTTLDTHDGIGVVDVKDLLPDEEIERTKEDINHFGANVKKIYSSAAYHNLDIYQVNCTYYSALGEDDSAYLIARAIQFFAPGIPQVYYVGMLAGRNDIQLIEKTRVGRDINRHYYTEEEIAGEVARPVVAKLLRLMRLRNQCAAFDGDFALLPSGDNEIKIRRQKGPEIIELHVDLKQKTYQVLLGVEGRMEIIDKQ